jgi:hypothetical protein
VDALTPFTRRLSGRQMVCDGTKLFPTLFRTIAVLMGSGHARPLLCEIFGVEFAFLFVTKQHFCRSELTLAEPTDLATGGSNYSNSGSRVVVSRHNGVRH